MSPADQKLIDNIIHTKRENGMAPPITAPHPSRDASTYPHLEQHVSGEDGPTVGWLWHVSPKHSIWCGEISRDKFDELEPEHREALGSDYGWVLILYGQRNSAVLGRALDEYQGRDLAEVIAVGLAAQPAMIAHLLQDARDFETGARVPMEAQ